MLRIDIVRQSLAGEVQAEDVVVVHPGVEDSVAAAVGHPEVVEEELLEVDAVVGLVVDVVVEDLVEEGAEDLGADEVDTEAHNYGRNALTSADTSCTLSLLSCCFSIVYVNSPTSASKISIAAPGNNVTRVHLRKLFDKGIGLYHGILSALQD